MADRGIPVTHTTILRWVQRYLPEFEKRWRRYARPIGGSWRMDETYIKVHGQWVCLYRAVAKAGQTVDFFLSRNRDVNAAKLFLRGARKNTRVPTKITLDAYAASHRAVREMQEDGELPRWVKVRSRYRTPQEWTLTKCSTPKCPTNYADTQRGAPVSETVPFTLIVGNGAPILQLSETGIQFPAVSVGQQSPYVYEIFLASSGDAIPYTAAASTLTGGNWLTVTPASGSASSSTSAFANISANPAGLAPGSYFGRVDFGAPSAFKPLQSVEVELKVTLGTAPILSTPILSTSAVIFVALQTKWRERKLRGHQQTIGERFEKDKEMLLPLPAAPYEACDKRSTRVTSMALVRYRANDYSVPVEWGHREVLVKGFVHEVVICAASEVIARHPRSYEREDMIFDPLHYLALLEQKPNALDQAAPLAGWDLPEGFAQQRRLIEARLGKKGKREYVHTLRLLELFALAEVDRAIEDALRLGAISFDAVKHLLLCRIEQRPARLDLENYPHLPAAQVATTAASENAAPANVPARVRQSRAAVCRQRRGLSALPAALERTGTTGPRTVHGTPYSASQV